MKINVRKKDTIWSLLGTIFAMGANFIILPFILHYLSDDSVAMYYVFTNLSALTTLFDFGFTPSFARSMAYAWSGSEELDREGVKKAETGEPNYSLMKKVIVTCRYIYLALAVIALILALSWGTVYVRGISPIADKTYYTISWMIYSSAIFLNLFYGYYAVFLRGVGAVAEVNVATVLSRSVQIIFSVIVLVCGGGLIGVAIVYLAYGFLFRMIAGNLFHKYKNIGKHLNEHDASVCKEDIKRVFGAIWPNTWKDGLVAIANYFLNQSTTILCSLYLTLHTTGVYSLCVQLTSGLATIAGVLYNTYQPALQSAYANRDTESQQKYMSIILTTFVGLYLMGTVVFILVGNTVIEMLKPSYSIPFGVMIGCLLYQFILKLRNCYTSYISTTNRLIYWKAFIISAGLCVASSVLLTGLLGLDVYGLIIAQIVSQLVFNIWYWPKLVHQELNLSPQKTLQYGVEYISKIIIKK